MINYDLKFILSDESVTVNNVDLKTFKYETKKKSEESVYDSGKRSYCERRGGLWRGPRSRVYRELESNLRDRCVVYCEWMSDSVITIVFSSGSIAYLTINPDTLDVTQVLFDRYCVGKLAGNPVTGVVFTPTHLLFTHAESTATLITFGTSKNAPNDLPLRLADRNLHVQSIELADGGRRAERRLSWCGGGVLVWTAAGAEPAPWSPGAHVPANLHLYQLSGQQMTVLAYHQLEGDTLSAEVSRDAHESHDTVHVVQQHVARKSGGGVSLTWLRYPLPAGTPPRTALPALPHRAAAPAALPSLARVTCRRAGGAGGTLAVACVGGTVHVIDSDRGLTHSARAAFIPLSILWEGGMLVAVSEETSRLQCFDRALQEMRCLQLRDNPRMKVLCSRALRSAGGGGAGGGAVLLAGGAGGGGGAALALLRLTGPAMPQGWLRAGRLSRAVNWLRAGDWHSEGDDCLRSLQLIANHVWRAPLSAAREAALQAALGSFLSCTCPPHKYRAPVTDLARKFYHHLLRRGRLDKALSLAVDLASPDLFADARHAALRAGRTELAGEAQELALQHHHESSCSSSCSCSQSSHSHSGSGAGSPAPPPLPRVPAPAHDPAVWTTDVSDNKIKRNVKWHSMDDVLTDTHHILRHSSLVTVAEHPRQPPEHPRQPPEHQRQPPEHQRQPPEHPRQPPEHQHQPPEHPRQPPEHPRQPPEHPRQPPDHPRQPPENPRQPPEHPRQPPEYPRQPPEHPRQPPEQPWQPTHHAVWQTSNQPIWNANPWQSPEQSWKSSVIEVLPRPHEEHAGLYGSLYRRELREDAATHMYRFSGAAAGRERRAEKNVKFSDTVTIAVVSEPALPPPGPSPLRELAESLPLCAPHKYLAAFEPRPAPPRAAAAPAPAPPDTDGTKDYVEV